MRRSLLTYLLFLLALGGIARAAPLPDRDPHGPPDVAVYIRHLEDPHRDAYQMPDRVMKTLNLAPDAIVADVGCGPGYFTRRLARAVPKGLVYAVDVEPRQLDRLRQHLHDDHTTNVVPVLASVDDPYLPPGRLDLILVVDTYHHFDHRADYLPKLSRALKPGGRLVVIDYFKRALPIGPPVPHKIDRETVLREVRAAGFHLVDEPKFLPYQFFLIFRRG
jgi:predicted methyltransferase